MNGVQARIWRRIGDRGRTSVASYRPAATLPAGPERRFVRRVRAALWARLLVPVWNRLRRAAVRYKLQRVAGLEFSQDYVSHHVPHWRRALASFISVDRMRALEIGSFEGRATVWFLEHVLTHAASTIVCVDNFARWSGEPRFDHNIALSGFAHKVEKLKGRSDEALLKLRGERFDFIYIDGSHRAHDVLMDVMGAWQLLKTGGVMILDDYRWEPDRAPLARPAIAIDLFLATARHQLEVLHKDYQVIIRKKA